MFREEYEDDSIRKVNAVRKSSQPIKKMKAEIMDETSKEAKRIITNNMRRKYDAEAKQLQGAVIGKQYCLYFVNCRHLFEFV